MKKGDDVADADISFLIGAGLCYVFGFYSKLTEILCFGIKLYYLEP